MLSEHELLFFQVSEFNKLELSVGVSITCAGTEDVVETLLVWWYFHTLFDLSELLEVLKYFTDLPTKAEYEGLTL